MTKSTGLAIIYEETNENEGLIMTKLCIFDLDGTLTDTIPAIAHFGNTALTSYGFTELPNERYKKLVGNGRDKLIHRMLRENGADTSENYEKVGKAYDAAYEADPLFETKPYDGIIELLDSLIKNGIKIAVLSNKPDNVAQDVVRLFFKDRFNAAYGQRNGIAIKPEPIAALEIAKELGIDVSEAVFIGDTNVDILTGKNAGMKTIGVLWGFRDKEELLSAGADYIVSKPLEILDIILK